jgi:transposase
MAIVTRFVGLDYHMDSIQVCVMCDMGIVLRNVKVPNQTEEVRRVVLQALPCEPGDTICVKAAVECCSGAAHLAEELMKELNWQVTLAHPGLVARMKQNPDKSDHADSFILADLMRLGYLPKVWLAPEEIRQLRSLVRHRAQLVKQRTRIKLRIRAILREQRLNAPGGISAWTRAWLHWLKALKLDPTNAFLRDEHLEELERLTQKIAQVEKMLLQQTAEDAVVLQLLEIEGIGPITAITMRAEIARFERFDSGKQLCRYCGVTPRNASSGQKQADAGLVKAGNPGLRIVLVQAAQRLMRTSPRWHAFAVRLKKKGKPHNVIVAAVANRWLRCLYHEMQPEQLAQGV